MVISTRADKLLNLVRQNRRVLVNTACCLPVGSHREDLMRLCAFRLRYGVVIGMPSILFYLVRAAISFTAYLLRT